MIRVVCGPHFESEDFKPDVGVITTSRESWSRTSVSRLSTGARWRALGQEGFIDEAVALALSMTTT